MVIGITDNMGAEHKWQWYCDWVSRGMAGVRFEKLSCDFDNAASVRGLHGLILTGGGDVDPGLFGSGMSSPKVKGVNRRRDDFERKVIDYALDSGIPILGICRGMQITNVHFGGTLILDLEDAGFLPHRAGEGSECHHAVSVKGGSLLARMSGSIAETVNSFHHQAVLSAGQGLKVSAVSPDGVIEALELASPDEKPFFLLIQWHPERMNDCDNPLSKNILHEFISSLQSPMNNSKKVRSII